jgi:23S rRNA (uracil1939-C5)-methyltransferase
MNLDKITQEVFVQGLSHEGRGVAKLGGKTLFIEGALKDERVRFVLKKKNRKYDEANVVEVLNAASNRVMPKCAHFAICGGCALQHMEPSSQISFKQAVLLEQLRHFGGVLPQEVLAPIIGPSFGYRRKARLGVKFVSNKNKILVGFREKHSHFLAELKQCEILIPQVGYLLEDLQELIAELEAFKTIPQIEVATGDKEIALVFRHLEPLSGKDKELLLSFGRTHNLLIYLQPGGMDSIHLLECLENRPPFLTYSLPAYDIEIQFHPTDFIQVNGDVNQKLIAKAIEWLAPKPTEQILDLFCGLGNFTLPLARFAKSVIGVEGSPEMVARAEENARHNGIKNVRFYSADLYQSLTGNESWLSDPYDKILLDPPRNGAEGILKKISETSVKTLVYISCNPATLARDVGILVKEYKFKFEKVAVLDMFPHTTHVESIALLTR